MSKTFDVRELSPLARNGLYVLKEANGPMLASELGTKASAKPTTGTYIAGVLQKAGLVTMKTVMAKSVGGKNVPQKLVTLKSGIEVPPREEASSTLADDDSLPPEMRRIKIKLHQLLDDFNELSKCIASPKERAVLDRMRKAGISLKI